MIATDISFTVDVYGNVTVENVDAVAVSEDGNPLIVMVDDTTKVRISKQDITTGEELPGAKLQVIDKNGDVIEEWTSTKEPHYLEAVLKAGETYAIANDVKFTVNADGTVTEVVMYDDAVPVTKSTPNTGDSGRNSLAYLMLAGSVIIFAALAISRKKKRRSEKADKNAAFCPDFVEVEHENE